MHSKSRNLFLSNLNYRIVIYTFLLSGISGCATGNKIIEQPEPFELNTPLGTWKGKTLNISLDWIIVRDGPGAWATNAYWDQYIFHVENLSETDVHISNVYIVDFLRQKVLVSNEIQSDRFRWLSKNIARRYRRENIPIQPGAGMDVVQTVAGSVFVAGTTLHVLGTIASGMPIIGGGAPLVAGAALPVLIAPVLMESYTQYQVYREMHELHETLPIHIEPFQGKRFNLFFPISPAPQKIVMEFTTSNKRKKRIELNTTKSLAGLHLQKTNSKE